MPAQRSDWMCTPMGERRATLAFERTYSGDEFVRLRNGVLPREMEDKWFVFYEEPWLYLHRSWTGICIYQVRFEDVRQGAHVVEALSAVDEKGHHMDGDLLGRLLDMWASPARG